MPLNRLLSLGCIKQDINSKRIHSYSPASGAHRTIQLEQPIGTVVPTSNPNILLAALEASCLPSLADCLDAWLAVRTQPAAAEARRLALPPCQLPSSSHMPCQPACCRCL